MQNSQTVEQSLPGVEAIKKNYGSNPQKDRRKLMPCAIKQNKVEKYHFTENKICPML